MVLPGTMARVLYPNLESPDLVYPTLVFDLLPIGIIGLVLAGLLAAMSSSISATLNSASTLVTMDFVSKLNPKLTSKQLVRTGQIATVILVVLAAVWAPQIEKFGSLFKYLQMVLGYIAPPVVVVFLGGLFWKRANGTGAFVSLMIGFFLTLFLIFSKVNSWWPLVDEMHFLHVAPLIFVVSSVVFISVSLLTPSPNSAQIESYIWKRELYIAETASLAKLPWYKNFRILSMLLLVLTAVIIAMFW